MRASSHLALELLLRGELGGRRLRRRRHALRAQDLRRKGGRRERESEGRERGREMESDGERGRKRRGEVRRQRTVRCDGYPSVLNAAHARSLVFSSYEVA
eukprot:2898609-Pleurochrysis_carterae.AAC.1